MQLDSLSHPAMVSRRHLRIRRKRGAEQLSWVIEDLGSANGTAVNGRRLHASKRVRVGHGDTVLLGSRGVSEALYRFEVHSEV